MRTIITCGQYSSSVMRHHVVFATHWYWFQIVTSTLYPWVFHYSNFRKYRLSQKCINKLSGALQNNFVSPYIQIKLQGVEISETKMATYTFPRPPALFKIFRFIYGTSSVCNISIWDDLPMNWSSCVTIIASVDKVFTRNWYNIAIQLHRKKTENSHVSKINWKCFSKYLKQ